MAEHWDAVLDDIVGAGRCHVEQFDYDDLPYICDYESAGQGGRCLRSLTVARERYEARLDADDPKWARLLWIEVGQALAAPTDPERYADLVRVIAIATAWAEVLQQDESAEELSSNEEEQLRTAPSLPVVWPSS